MPTARSPRWALRHCGLSVAVLRPGGRRNHDVAVTRGQRPPAQRSIPKGSPSTSRQTRETSQAVRTMSYEVREFESPPVAGCLFLPTERLRRRCSRRRATQVGSSRRSPRNPAGQLDESPYDGRRNQVLNLGLGIRHRVPRRGDTRSTTNLPSLGHQSGRRCLP